MKTHSPKRSGSDDAYLARCLKTLKDWQAPLQDWYCVDMVDYGEDDGALATCELCGCVKVRFIHVMAHDYWFENLEVGCICAGVMEGDQLAAKERERKLRNWVSRRNRFIQKPWKTLPNGNRMIRHNGQTIFINHHPTGCYSVKTSDGKTSRCYRGKPITNTLSAAYAAFNLIDPKTEAIQ